MQQLVVDLETTGLNPRKDKILECWVHNPSLSKEPIKWDLERLKDWAAKGISLLIFQNMKFDLHMLYTHGVDLRGYPVRDTMLMHHLIDEEADHDLGSMVLTNFGDSYKHLFWSKYARYEDAPQEERDEYAKKDVLYTGKLYNIFLDQLAHAGVPDTLVEHAHRLALALLDTEIRGVKLDLEYTHKMGDIIQGKLLEIKPRMRHAAKLEINQIEVGLWEKEVEKYKTPKRKQLVTCPEFNWDSSSQLKDLLYSKLGLPAQYNSKTRQVSTDDASLVSLGDAHPIVPMLRSYRENQKVYTSYIEGMLERAEGDRIYPSFNVNGTATGRISHSNPNLGQMPASGGIRGMFIPEPGHKILSADYSQLEITLAAHFSRDPNLLKVVLEGASLHDITASALGIERSLAKTLNFAIQYGAQEHRIMHVLGCSMDDAKYYLNKYWQTYPKLKEFIDACHYKVDHGIPIVNPFGRVRHFPTRFSSHRDRARAHRQAFNALIQGTGGDLTSKAFYDTVEYMDKADYGKGLFTVHDELLVMPKDAHVVDTQEILDLNMVGAGTDIGLTVPLTVQISDGMDRWED